MLPQADYPDFVARFYDVIYGKILSGADADFYLKSLLEARGPVLEIGVGTGRLFTAALKQGADITGIDISPEMVDVLRAKLEPADRYRVRVMDARLLSLARRFSLAVAPFRILSHVSEVEDQLAVLNKVHEHLRPGGKFIFDVFVPDPKLLHEGMDGVVDFEGEYAPGQRLRRTTFMKADMVNQLSHVRMKFEWDEGGRQLEKEWTFSLRFFFRYELESLVALSRLKLENIYGDFNRSPLQTGSKEFVVVCRRA